MVNMFSEDTSTYCAPTASNDLSKHRMNDKFGWLHPVKEGDRGDLISMENKQKSFSNLLHWIQEQNP